MFIFKKGLYYTNKNIFSYLISIFGIGFSRAKYICTALNIPLYKKVQSLNDNEIKKISDKIIFFKIEDTLKKEIKLNINNLISLKCYKGDRHKKNLPVRGQNTKNNSRTRKGPKKSIFFKNNNFNFKNVKKNKKKK